MSGSPVSSPGMNAEFVVTNRKDSGLSKICNTLRDERCCVQLEATAVSSMLSIWENALR